MTHSQPILEVCQPFLPLPCRCVSLHGGVWFGCVWMAWVGRVSGVGVCQSRQRAPPPPWSPYHACPASAGGKTGSRAPASGTVAMCLVNEDPRTVVSVWSLGVCACVEEDLGRGGKKREIDSCFGLWDMCHGAPRSQGGRAGRQEGQSQGRGTPCWRARCQIRRRSRRRIWGGTALRPGRAMQRRIGSVASKSAADSAFPDCC